jgi:serpin B
MTAAGAAGETLAEMTKVLGLGPGEAPFAASLSEVARELDHASTSSRQGSETPLEWSMANRLFAERSYVFLEKFSTFLERHYGAGVEGVDFSSVPEAARVQINSWITQKTKGRVADILSPNAVTPLSRLILVNALYLKAPWAEVFPMRATRDEPFHLGDGRSISTPFMRRTDRFPYAETAAFKAVGVPFSHGGLQALFIVPTPGRALEDLLAELSGEELSNLANGGSERLDLAVPKFTFEGATLNLKELFYSLGMARAFDSPPGSADFSRMTGKPDLFISGIFHKVFVAIDENGAEAAASTAVSMKVRGMPVVEPDPIRLVVDRPFLFAIQHRSSGMCLFLGAIGTPQG